MRDRKGTGSNQHVEREEERDRSWKRRRRTTGRGSKSSSSRRRISRGGKKGRTAHESRKQHSRAKLLVKNTTNRPPKAPVQ